jgi:hypothetical protein
LIEDLAPAECRVFMENDRRLPTIAGFQRYPTQALP